jgi:hypothetical protein
LKNKYEIRRKTLQREVSKERATGINYKMHEIKPSYCSKNYSPTRRHDCGFIEGN